MKKTYIYFVKFPKHVHLSNPFPKDINGIRNMSTEVEIFRILQENSSLQWNGFLIRASDGIPPENLYLRSRNRWRLNDDAMPCAVIFSGELFSRSKNGNCHWCIRCYQCPVKRSWFTVLRSHKSTLKFACLSMEHYQWEASGTACRDRGHLLRLQQKRTDLKANLNTEKDQGLPPLLRSRCTGDIAPLRPACAGRTTKGTVTQTNIQWCPLLDLEQKLNSTTIQNTLFNGECAPLWMLDSIVGVFPLYGEQTLRKPTAVWISFSWRIHSTEISWTATRYRCKHSGTDHIFISIHYSSLRDDVTVHGISMTEGKPSSESSSVFDNILPSQEPTPLFIKL